MNILIIDDSKAVREKVNAEKGDDHDGGPYPTAGDPAYADKSSQHFS